MSKFLKCTKKSTYDKLIKDGFSFMYEENGVYWFIAKDNMMFTFTESDIQTTEAVNL